MTADHHPSLLVRTGDTSAFIGVVEAASVRMRGEIWVIHHARDDWTHLYRIDARLAGTVHLLRCEQGDRRLELSAWALGHLPVAAPVRSIAA